MSKANESGKQAANRIVNQAYKEYFLIGFAGSFVYTIGTLVDTSISGLLFDMDALAGVGITRTFITFYTLLSSLLFQGMKVILGNAVGRGESEKANRFFSASAYVNIGVSILLGLAIIPFASQMLYLLGARDAEINAYATTYLRASLIAQVCHQFAHAPYDYMLMLGYKKECSFKNVVRSVTNIVASLFLVQVVGMGIEALGYGAAIGYLCTFAYLVISYKMHPTSMKFYIRPGKEAFGKIKVALSYAMPDVTHNMGEFVTGTVLNNAVALTVGSTGLAILSLFKTIRQLATSAIAPSTESMSALSLTMLGSHDISGLKQTVKGSVTIPSIATFLLSTALFILRRPVLAVFGATDPVIVSAMTSAFACLIAVSVFNVLNDTVLNFYTITGHRFISSVSFVINCALYMGFAVLLVNLIGVSGVWYAYLANHLVFFATAVVVISIKTGHVPRNMDEAMLLPKKYYDNKNLLEFSMEVKKNQNFEKIDGIRQLLEDHNYDEATVYQCEACLEELLIRVLAKKKKPTYVDIRLFIQDDNLRFSMRDNGPMKNHLIVDDTENKEENVGISIVRKMARAVNYSYMAGFNVLNVEI